MHVRKRKTRIRANRANVRDVIIKPLELEQNYSEIRRASGNRHPGERFHGLTKREGVRHARIAGNSLGGYMALEAATGKTLWKAEREAFGRRI